MALTDFREAFAERYQDILGKSLVAMKVANTGLQAGLKYGDKVHRFKLDLTGVVVRDVTVGSDQTIDAITDSDETLDVDQKKGAAFPISSWEEIQAGPLKPALTAGREVALKVKRYIDADVFYGVTSATYTFDNGNLTTLSSDATPITLSTSNAPVMVTRVAAMLQAGNVPEGNWAFVLDPYAISIIAQHAIGKDLDLSENILRNGYSGPLFGFKVYSSNNLTGEAVLGMATQPTANDTVVIEGVTFTFVASPSAAGDIDLGADVDATRANLEAAINAGSGAGSDYIELSAADRKTITYDKRITATNNDTTNKLTIVGKGSGRLTLSETFTDATDAWDKNFVHCFAGKVGSIDLVVQKDPMPVLREEPKQETVNVLVNTLYGTKVFNDGANKMIDLKIAA